MPWAAESLGSSWSALLTLDGGGAVWLACKVEAGEDEVGGDVGVELERGLGFGAGVGGVAAVFADLGEAGVGGGAGGVGGEGGLELLFGFGDEALGEVVAAELGVLGGLFGRRKRGHADGAHLVELEGGLAEGGFGVGAADALEWGRSRRSPAVACAWRWGDVSARGDVRFEFGGFGVGGAELEGLVDFALGSGEVASAEQGDGEVVVVVGVVGIGGEARWKRANGVVALAAGGDGLVVDDFGEGEAAGDEGEGGLGFGVFGGVEAGEAEVEVASRARRSVGGILARVAAADRSRAG